MTFEIALVLTVVIAALLLFVRERLAPDGIALGCLLVLVLSGVLSPQEAFAAFGNEALITVAALFVVAGALSRTGAVDFIGRSIMQRAAGSEGKAVLALMLAGAGASAFINNTPIIVVFLPIALSLAAQTGTAPSKLLMPLSFATIAGGMLTVIGTSTNVLVSASLPTYGLERLPLLTPLPLALIGLVLTITYMQTIGRRLLPSRTGVVSARVDASIYVTELEPTDDSVLVGRQLTAIADLLRERGITMVQAIRHDDVIDLDDQSIVLAAADVLIVQGDLAAVHNLLRTDGLRIARELATPGFLDRKDATLAELLVRPPSTAIGERVRDLNLYLRHGVAVIAVQRRGHRIHDKVARLKLRVGDILLVQALAEQLHALQDARNFTLIEGAHERVKLSHKARSALLITGGVIALAMLDLTVLPMSIAAVLGAVLMVRTGCIGLRDAYRALDLPLLVLIGGTIALGVAMQQSGAAAFLAKGLMAFASPFGPVGLLSIIYLITNVLTALISNNASALLMLPIAIATAETAGLNTTAFIVAVMFAASIDYSTPIGYQVNTIIYGPGGYRFRDFVKVGGPLNVLWWLLASALIPVFWPLQA